MIFTKLILGCPDGQKSYQSGNILNTVYFREIKEYEKDVKERVCGQR